MIKTKFSRFAAMIMALVMVLCSLSINTFAESGSITFIVTGDSIHNNGEHNGYDEWINTSYELNGENIGEIMEAVLSQYGYSCDYSIGQYGGYLNSITTPEGETLGAYTNGSKSGWMSSINDVITDVSMDQAYPKSGDVVEIFYIDDYEAEIYGYYSTFNLNPADTVLRVSDSAGNVIEPSWGAYSLFNGKYSYSASADGYITQNGDFTVSGAGVTIDITLEKENNSSTEDTTEKETASYDNGEWGLFRKDSLNIPVVNADTPYKGNAEIKWASKVNTDWSGFSGIAITEDSIFASADSTVYKIDKNSGKITANAALDGAIYYTYFIAYGDGKVFVQLSDGRIEAFDSDSLNKLWTSKAPNGDTEGNGISPLYYNDGKVYCGTVCFNNKGKGYYYCLNADTGEYIWTIEGAQGEYNGFYWSGCAAVGDCIVVGGEGGKLYIIESDGSIADTYTVKSDIRSTVVYSNGYIYFTDKIGNIYSAAINGNKFGEVKSALINEKATSSTSTPAVYNGKIYVGAAGSYDMNTYSTSGYFSVFDIDLNNIYTVETEGPVQSSPLISIKGDDVKVYFTCNNSEGSLKVYDGNKCDDLINLSEYSNYCLHSVIADSNGTIYYQNDSGNIIAIGKSFDEAETETITETETSTEIITDTATEVTTSSHSGNGGGGGASKINVSFTLTGNSLWLTESNVYVNANTSAAELLKKVFDDNNVACEGLDTGYIKSVTYNGITLREFEKGPNSGWMYKVNGETPEISINNYKLSSGDKVELVYVEDYTKVNYGGNSYWDDEETSTEVTTTEATESMSADESINNEKTEIVVDGKTLSHTFKDINERHWANEAVTVLYSKGIINGKTKDTFAPVDKVTRAEFLVMLYRMSGDNGKYSCDLTDISNENWYYNEASWAYNNGIVYGVGENRLNPDALITRQDMACIIDRYAEKYGVKLEQNSIDMKFEDLNEISDYAVSSVNKLYGAGVLKGNDKNEFMPKAYTTRAEAAVVIYSLIKK